MNCSTPSLPVHHQLPEFTQTHVHRVGDAIQPSHPLSSSSPPAPNPSQHQSFPMSQLCMRWPKDWSFSFSIIPSKEHPGLIFLPQGSNKSQSNIQNGDSNSTLFEGVIWINSFNKSLLSYVFLNKAWGECYRDHRESKTLAPASKGIYDEEGWKVYMKINTILNIE